MLVLAVALVPVLIPVLDWRFGHMLPPWPVPNLRLFRPHAPPRIVRHRLQGELVVTETTFNVEKFKYTNSALRSAPAYSCVSGRKEKLDSRRSYPGPGTHTFEARELIALKPKAGLLGKAAFVTESGLVSVGAVSTHTGQRWSHPPHSPGTERQRQHQGQRSCDQHTGVGTWWPSRRGTRCL